MAAPTDRSPAGLLVCLVDPLSDRHALAGRCVEASCATLDQADGSAQKERDAVYSGRMPRFVYLASHRERWMERTSSPHEISRPEEMPVIGRSNEEGVR